MKLFDKYIFMMKKEISKELAELITANVVSAQKEVLTTDECAKYLGVSKSFLYKLTSGRQIPHYKSPTGKLCFFDRREVENWMKSVKVRTDQELEEEAQKQVKKGGKR